MVHISKILLNLFSLFIILLIREVPGVVRAWDQHADFVCVGACVFVCAHTLLFLELFHRFSQSFILSWYLWGATESRKMLISYIM